MPFAMALREWRDASFLLPRALTEMGYQVPLSRLKMQMVSLFSTAKTSRRSRMPKKRKSVTWR